MKPYHTAVAQDFSAYVGIVETIPLLSGPPMFRGQPVQGNLLPSIARQNPAIDSIATERKMLGQLELLAASLLPVNETPLDRLVLAQHYGMKTRLLDWTSNPLAALWFACSDQSDGDVYVYSFDTENTLREAPYEHDPFSHGKTIAFQPRLNNPRILAQHGWFTLHSYSLKSRRWVPLERHATHKQRLIEILVPSGSRRGMLNSLARHGMSARTLFPDIGGTCQFINWQHDVA